MRKPLELMPKLDDKFDSEQRNSCSSWNAVGSVRDADVRFHELCEGRKELRSCEAGKKGKWQRQRQLRIVQYQRVLEVDLDAEAGRKQISAGEMSHFM